MAVERTHTVSVRLSPAEHAVWVAAARGDGRGRVGAWVRDRVAATLPAAAVTTAAVGMSAGTDGGSRWVFPASSPSPVAVVGVPAAEWAGLRAELGRVGNNLNQAVRLANSSGVNPARVVEMADAAERARVVMAGLLAAVRAATADRPVTEPGQVGGRSLAEQVAAAAADRAAGRAAGGRAAAGAAGRGVPR